METVTYPYRPQTRPMLLGCGLFGFGGLYMAYTAVTNDRGLVLDGLFHFGREGATLFYWVTAAICAAFFLLGLAVLVIASAWRREVNLTADEISAPRAVLFPGVTTVKLSQVKGLGVLEIRNQRFLSITHPQGKLSIPAIALPDSASFDRLCGLMAERVRSVPR